MDFIKLKKNEKVEVAKDCGVAFRGGTKMLSKMTKTELREFVETAPAKMVLHYCRIVQESKKGE